MTSPICSRSEFWVRAAQILAIDPDRAGRRIIEAQDKGKNGALARAARADQRVSFSGLDPKIQIFHRIGDAAGVAERDVLEIDQPSRMRKSFGVGRSCTVGV